MMYRTHKAGGCLFALLGFEVLKQNGLLVSDMNTWVQLAIMYPAVSFGSTAPDLDHHWDSVKEKTPANMLVHKILHLSHPHHRSWQTHSVLVTGGFCMLLMALLFWISVQPMSEFRANDIACLRLLITGFAVGVLSHLVLDSFTRMGVQIIPGVTFRLVPNSEVFSTDTPYETVVRRIVYFLICLTALWVFNPFDLQSHLLAFLGAR